MKTLENLRELAYRAHSGTSFSPEKRSESIVNDYSEEIDNDVIKITAQGANSEQIERYVNGYKSKLTTYLHSQSNVMSTMITGPANFPVESNRKKSNWADNHYTHFREWRKKVLNAYDRYEKKAKIEEQGGEIEVQKKRLESLLINHELMKEGNKKIKDAKKMYNIDEYLTNTFNIQPHMIDWTMKFGFGLTNSNATIKRVQERIKELEKKEANATKGNKITEFEGGKVILNYEIDRLQIQHDTKPEQSIINELKSAGFKWSPFYKVWQRQLTNNALYITRNILKIAC